MSSPFQPFQTPGPTARMSQTVRIIKSFSRSGLCTMLAKVSIVLGSAMSRDWAVMLIVRCCSMSQATVSVSAGLSPSRGHSARASSAPAIEWSCGRPLATSCRKAAT